MRDAELEFEEETLDRRGSFRTLGASSMESIVELCSHADFRTEIKAYGLKEIPPRRRMLGNAISMTSGELRNSFLAGLYSSITAKQKCNGCALCSALCPTGAIRVGHGGKTRSLSMPVFVPAVDYVKVHAIPGLFVFHAVFMERSCFNLSRQLKRPVYEPGLVTDFTALNMAYVLILQGNSLLGNFFLCSK